MVSEKSGFEREQPSPFWEALGMEIIEADAGIARLRLPFRPNLANRKLNVHGGAIATLADMAMGQAIRSIRTGPQSSSTISLTVNYLSPGVGDLVAVARCTRAGLSVSFASVDITSSDGHLVATATGTFKLFQSTPQSSLE